MTYSLAVHGGAGTILKSRMTPELEAAYHAGLARALEAGQAVLKEGGAALDAVTAAVCALEDEPLFNAGRGAVFTAEGKQEMDAAIMDGATRRAGTVAGIFGPRNPIRAARAVMDRTEHVMLIGENALRIARESGLPFEETDYFFTQARWDALQQTLEMRAKGQENDDPGAAPWHGRCGGPRHAWPSCRRDLDRGHDGKGAGPCRGHAGDRRGHLRRRCDLCRLGHRAWRDLHPLDRRCRDQRAHAASGGNRHAGRGARRHA